MFESFVHLGHFEALRDWRNLVPGAKVDPSPPMPITPTRSVGLTLFCTMGLKTVLPPQKSGSAEA
jgi:hypothetical protein